MSLRAPCLFRAESVVVARGDRVSFFRSSVDDESQTRSRAGDRPQDRHSQRRQRRLTVAFRGAPRGWSSRGRRSPWGSREERPLRGFLAAFLCSPRESGRHEARRCGEHRAQQGGPCLPEVAGVQAGPQSVCVPRPCFGAGQLRPQAALQADPGPRQEPGWSTTSRR